MLLARAAVPHAPLACPLPAASLSMLAAQEKGGALSLSEVEDAARRIGCQLVVKATGPVYKIELLWDEGQKYPAPRVQMLGYNDEPLPPPELLGYSTGFTQPTGIVHLETIEVRKFTGFWARKTQRGGERYAAVRSLNPGLLVGAAVVCWCRENDPFGGRRAHLLCIRDDERQHKALVRYYRKLGFTPLREVRSDLRDMADRVVWGGEGTLMELDLGEHRRPRTRARRTLPPFAASHPGSISIAPPTIPVPPSLYLMRATLPPALAQSTSYPSAQRSMRDEWLVPCEGWAVAIRRVGLGRHHHSMAWLHCDCAAVDVFGRGAPLARLLLSVLPTRVVLRAASAGRTHTRAAIVMWAADSAIWI